MGKGFNIAGLNMPSARVGAGSLRAALMLALVVLPLTLLLLENASALNARLVFSTKTKVDTPMVYLDDIIASYNGNELLRDKSERIIIASAPSPGRVKIIQRPLVMRALRKHNLTKGDADIFIPEEITITRSSKVFKIKDIETIIRRELTKNNFIDNKNTLFTLSNIQKDVILPKAKVSTIVKMPGRIKDKNKFWVSFFINGKLKSRIWANGTIKRNLDVLAVNKKISLNEIIKEEDLIYLRKNILELNGDYITNKRAVIGKKALKNMSAGTLFKRKTIGSVPTVKAGDRVSILVRMKNLTLNASGKILSASGKVGDTVSVLNVNSREKLKAVVLNRATVEVEVY